MYKCQISGYTHSIVNRNKLVYQILGGYIMRANTILMSDNVNYLCVRAKEQMELGRVSDLEVVYDSVLNQKNQSVSVTFEEIDKTIERMRDLLNTCEYRKISIKGIGETAEVKEDSVRGKSKGRPVGSKKESDTKEKGSEIKRGAPSLSQDVIDERYDIITSYSNKELSSKEAMEKMGVTEGVFRNLVSEYNKCHKLGRRKAFGKMGILKRTCDLYSKNKITSSQAASNVGVSVATFLKWYKEDTGKGTKRVKKG